MEIDNNDKILYFDNWFT